jgi:hypothetical protein
MWIHGIRGRAYQSRSQERREISYGRRRIVDRGPDMEPSRPFCVEGPVREEQFRTQMVLRVRLKINQPEGGRVEVGLPSVFPDKITR